MTAPADRIFTDAEVHTLASHAVGRGEEDANPDADGVAEAVAVRDGDIVRVGSAYEVGFLAGVDTDVVDCGGRVVLPGFIDAHTHMAALGQRLEHADLGGADSVEEVVSRLVAAGDDVAESNDGATGVDDGALGVDDGSDWILGFGYDASEWGGEALTCADLDRVGDRRPVAAVHADRHTVSVNSVALDRLDLPAEGVRRRGGDQTGVLVEPAAAAVRDEIEPDRARTRVLLRSAIDHALARGVTGVHDVPRSRHAPGAYRDLARAGDLDLRVRVNYLASRRGALETAGVSTNDGDDRVTVGAIKTAADGRFGARTAKLRAPYADGAGTGQWVVDPADLSAVVADAADAGYQVAIHAVGDAAVAATLDAYADVPDRRHRVEHATLLDDDLICRMADLGVVASVQPNFLARAGEGGSYERRLGDRARRTNRLGDLHEAGVPLAFGSDGTPLDPLVGVDCVVNAPHAGQRLSVTDALVAYTSGSAYAGFEEDRLGTVEVGTHADLVLLDGSPWEADAIRDVDVAMTVVDGDVVYDAR